MSIELAISAEMELRIAMPGTHESRDAASRGWQPIRSGAAMRRPSNLRQARFEMEQTYESLVPETPAEAERHKEWLDYVTSDKVTPEDVVNYRIYQGTSTPALTYAHYPVGTPLRQLTSSAGETEFRGPGILQRGWYDNPGISEVRQTPTPEREFRSVHNALLLQIGDIAAGEGHVAYRATTHLNMSAFRDGTALLGDPNEDPNPYKAVAAGLRAVYREGALLNPAALPRVRSSLSCTPLRTGDIRLLPGRIEVRNYDDLDGPDQRNMERLGRVGIRHAFEGVSDDARDKTFMARMLQVDTPNNYDKDADLPFVRAIEACGYLGDKLTMADPYVKDASDIVSALVGRPVRCNAQEMAHFMTNSFQIDEKGKMVLSASAPALHNGFLSTQDKDTINNKLAPYTVTPREMVYHSILDCGLDEQIRGLKTATVLPSLDPQGYAELRAACTASA